MGGEEVGLEILDLFTAGRLAIVNLTFPTIILYHPGRFKIKKMKRLLLCAVTFYSCSSFSQTSFQYANFIQTDTAVKWAAIYNSYVNLTPANPNFDIRNFYLKKLEAGNIKAYKEDNVALSVTPYGLSNTSFL